MPISTEMAAGAGGGVIAVLLVLLGYAFDEMLRPRSAQAHQAAGRDVRHFARGHRVADT